MCEEWWLIIGDILPDHGLELDGKPEKYLSLYSIVSETNTAPAVTRAMFLSHFPECFVASIKS